MAKTVAALTLLAALGVAACTDMKATPVGASTGSTGQASPSPITAPTPAPATTTP
jgi:hypothetical protein